MTTQILLKSSKALLPVQTVDHVSHGVDEIIVFLGVTDNDAMEPLHVGVDGFKGGCLSTSCRTTMYIFMFSVICFCQHSLQKSSTFMFTAMNVLCLDINWVEQGWSEWFWDLPWLKFFLLYLEIWIYIKHWASVINSCKLINWNGTITEEAIKSEANMLTLKTSFDVTSYSIYWHFSECATELSPRPGLSGFCNHLSVSSSYEIIPVVLTSVCDVCRVCVSCVRKKFK